MIRLLLLPVMCCVVGWLFCDIEPDYTYTWYSGIWHGLFFWINLIRSWFTGALYKADSYTTAYNVFYWITTIWVTLGFILDCIESWRSRMLIR